MHSKFIKFAAALALKGYSKVYPNPPVGAVVVIDNKVISTGYHGEQGHDHAEIVAISKANKNELKNAILYVSLEPCNHYGRTPPCSIAIVNSGLKQVYFGVNDVNDEASGGASFLKENGVQAYNLDSEIAKRIVEPWLRFKSSKIKTLEYSLILSLNGFQLLDHNLKYPEISIFTKYLKRRVQCFNDAQSYHILKPFRHFQVNTNTKNFLNILRLPLFSKVDDRIWTHFVIENELKLLNVSRLGNAVIEKYEICSQG